MRFCTVNAKSRQTNFTNQRGKTNNILNQQSAVRTVGYWIGHGFHRNRLWIS